MSSSRRHSTSTTPSNAPNKSVRFAPTSENGSSRPLTTVEAWSLYNFELHARSCPTCQQGHSDKAVLGGGRLCATGDALSQDVACHIFSRDTEIYAVGHDRTTTARLVRVEIPHGYTYLRRFLRSSERERRGRRERGMERERERERERLRSHTLATAPVLPTRPTTNNKIDARTPVIVYPVSSSSSSPSTRRTYHLPDKYAAVLEPASSTPQSQRRQYRNPRYSSSVVANCDANVGEEDDEDEEVTVVRVPAPATTSNERRGTLYEREAQRRKERVRVEVREPDAQERERERRHRRGSVWM